MLTTITFNNKSRVSLSEIWRYRELLYFLSWRDIKVRYKQTFIGIFWAILQPILVMVVFTFFFNKVLQVTPGTIPYPVFSFSGLLFWNYFSMSLSSVSNSLITDQSIITKVYFPRIIIPIASAITPLLDFFFSMIVFFVLLLFFKTDVNFLGLFMIFPEILLTLTTTVGLGSILSIINIKYRDVRYALPFFIQLLLFVTPVIYSIHQVPKNLQLFLYLNPLGGIIELLRHTLFQNYELNVIGVGISILSSLVLFVMGVIIFMRFERQIADDL